MTDTISWATRYLMALESDELHQYSYDYEQQPPFRKIENFLNQDNLGVAEASACGAASPRK